MYMKEGTSQEQKKAQFLWGILHIWKHLGFNSYLTVPHNLETVILFQLVDSSRDAVANSVIKKVCFAFCMLNKTF